MMGGEGRALHIKNRLCPACNGSLWVPPRPPSHGGGHPCSLCNQTGLAEEYKKTVEQLMGTR